MRPNCKVSINGALASGVMMRRLISVSISDNEGLSSDTAKVVLSNFPSARIPMEDDVVIIWLGNPTLQHMGVFKVADVELTLFPHTMTITCKAADFRATMKEQKERSWSNATVKDIVSEIAADNGLSAKIDGAVAAHKYPWFGQQGESDFQVLRRLEQAHGAMFSTKDDKLIFADRGSGKAPGGNALGKYALTKGRVLEGSARIKLNYSKRFKQVAATYHDRAKAQRGEVKAEALAEGKATYKIREPFGSKAEAKEAAKSKAKQIKLGIESFSCRVIGDSNVRAGMQASFVGSQAGVDGIPLMIASANHSWSKSNYVVSISGKGAA